MKKIFSVLFTLMMFFALDVNASSAPSVGNEGTKMMFFANGTSITIQSTVPTSGELVDFGSSFTGTGTSAYIVWLEGSTTKYVGINNTVTVFGGVDGYTTPADVASTSITMTGGEVFRLYGGNHGADATVAGADVTLDTPSKVTGDVLINVTGGTIGSDIYGGGRYNASVEGKVTLNVTGATFANGVYVAPGVHGNGKEGKFDYINKVVDTNAVVNEAEVNFGANTSLGDTYLFAGTSGGFSKVLTTVVNLGDGVGTADTLISYVFMGGVNGYTNNATLNVKSDAKITKELAQTNRGYVNNSTINVTGGYVEKLFTGASTECFGTDGNIASGMIGELVVNVDSTGVIKNATLTPQANKLAVGYSFGLGNVEIINANESNVINFVTAAFDTGNDTAGRNITTFTISSGEKITLGENTKLTISALNAVNNAGELVVNEYRSEGTFNNSGTFKVNEEALNNGEIVNTGSIEVAGTLGNETLGTINNTGGKISTTETGSIDENTTVVGSIAKEIITENKQTYNSSTSTNLVLSGNGVLGVDGDFTEGTGSVEVDGEVVDPTNYTLTSGSVIVTFKKAFLDSLSAGDHVFSLVYNDGSFANTVFAVAEQPNPQTGDNLVMYIVLLTISIVGLTGGSIYLKRKMSN